MQIENQFEIPLPPAAAWTIVMNIPKTAACFPGAGMVEQTGADQYKARVTVKLGPLTMVFAGNIRIEERDDAGYRATVKANWTEMKGRGSAITITQFALRGQGDGTLVTVQSDLQLAGQVAQYGRGVGMIADISAQLISTFAKNLCARIQAADADENAPAGSSETPAISGLTLVAKALGNRLKR
jgi:carbon monoxide dehydrogenase subunit G